MSDNKWHEIISKLLAKAEDYATTNDERETIQEKVLYLMAKFSIDQAVFDAGQKKEYKVISVRYRIVAPYVNQKALLLNGIATAFGSQLLELNKGLYVMYGHEDDQEKVFMLYNSLLIQMYSAMATAWDSKPHYEHGKTFNTSFVNGYVRAVINRVKAAYIKAQADVQETTTGTDLVLRNRVVAVQEMFSRDYPNTHIVKTSSTSRSATGGAAGRTAGQNADIGQTTIGGRKMIGG